MRQSCWIGWIFNVVTADQLSNGGCSSLADLLTPRHLPKACQHRRLYHNQALGIPCDSGGSVSFTVGTSLASASTARWQPVRADTNSAANQHGAPKRKTPASS